MRRRSPVELEVNQDRWLVSYSDFVTLLFAFFVVMYSISYVNEGKYRVISSTLLEAFNVPQSAINPIQVGDPTLAIEPSVIDQSADDGAKQEPNSLAEFDVLAAKLEEQFSDLIDEEVFKLNSNELWLELEIKSKVLFPSASADPSLQAKAILEELASTLADYGNGVQVGGFTDDVPINNRNFKSNWELSSARATSVVKLLAKNGVQPERLSAVGYGEFQPVSLSATG